MDRSLSQSPLPQALESRRLFSSVAPVIAPTDLTVTALTPSSARLIYTDNSVNEQSFFIFRSTDDVTFTKIATVKPNTQRFDDTTLIPDTTYYYRIKAHALTANSAYSNEAQVTTGDVTSDNFATLDAAGTLTINGTPQDDIFTLDVAAGILTATLNGDALTFTNGSVKQIQIYMQDGNDSVTNGPSTAGAYINGGAGNDTILGGGHNDRIDGGAGDDFLMGRDGNDTITGGIGNDTIYGQDGSDSLNGNEGDDKLVGGDKPDTLVGGVGNDSLYGQGGIDSLDANGGGRDLLVQD